MYQGDVGSFWEQLVHWKCCIRSLQDTKGDDRCSFALHLSLWEQVTW